MRYLNSRDIFLKKIKETQQKNSPFDDNYLTLEEAGSDYSGPFANDISWNDSLLGKTINSLLRKYQVRRSLSKMKSVIRRLNDSFNLILSGNLISELSDEEMKELYGLIVYFLLYDLKQAVERGDEISIVKDLTDKAINGIEKINEKYLDDKNDLLDQLRKFRAFLDTLGEKSQSDVTEEPESGSINNKSLYTLMIKNLEYLSGILYEYKNVIILEVGKEYTFTNKNGGKQKVMLVSTKNAYGIGKDRKWITKDDEKKEPQSAGNVFVVFKDDDGKYTSTSPTMAVWAKQLSLESNSFIITESNYILDLIKEDWTLSGDAKINPEKSEYVKQVLAKQQKDKEEKERIEREKSDKEKEIKNKSKINEPFLKTKNQPTTSDAPKPDPNITIITKNETHLKQAFLKLKESIKNLLNANDKGIGITHKFINQVISDCKMGGETKPDIQQKSNAVKTTKKLYSEIYEHLYGKYSSSVYNPDKLYENIQDVESNTKTIAEKIARFSKRSLQFENEGLYGGLGKLGKYLEQFNVSLKKIMESYRNNQSTQKPTTENILSYDNFIRISEANEGDDTADLTIVQKIQKYWKENIKVERFFTRKESHEDLKKRLEELEKNSKDNPITLKEDQVIEIIKIFNNAYKLHTTQVIPTSRSDGKVSNRVFREYTCFGDGNPKSAGESGGPYRNNKIFNNWEESVFEILKTPNYQKIFREETKLKTNDGKVINGAGKNLAKFMTDMLDGDKLYRTGGRGETALGAQAAFLYKYFGIGVKGDDICYKDDKEPVTNTIEDMDKVRKTLTFTDNILNDIRDIDQLEKTFFAVKATDEKGKSKILYFYINHISNDRTAYITYCESLYFYRQYIMQSGTALNEIKKGNVDMDIIELKNKDENEYPIRLFKISKLDSLIPNGAFKPGKYSITYITKPKNTSPDDIDQKTTASETITIQKSFSLCEIVEGNKLSRFKLDKPIPNIVKIGGFQNTEKTGEKTEIKNA